MIAYEIKLFICNYIFSMNSIINYIQLFQKFITINYK